MRNLKIYLVAMLLTMGTAVFANTNPVKVEKPETITEQIAELLKNPTFKVEQDIMAKVTLMVNGDKELVVLNVDTEDQKIESFIKSRLNYQKLETTATRSQLVVPVRVVPGA